MKSIYFKFLFVLMPVFTGYSQFNLEGTIYDTTGVTLPGVNVSIKNTTKGVVTDFNGFFEIEVEEGAILVFSYVGLKTQEIEVQREKATLKVILESSNTLSQVVLVGTRNPKRTITDSPVPVDIIDVKSVVNKTGRVEVTDLLQFAAPSFNAQKQSGADGADHITPATLRGQGPDQTLVLINGKRRHQSSLVNLFGTRGRGNSGTDLNAIPATAIKRIEVLRDGAAAQYGSDAIAGVINIVLKDNVNELSGEVLYGFNDANSEGGFGIPARKGIDGNTIKLTTNYGFSLGDKGGFINATGEFLSKERTLRPGASFRSKFGEAAIDAFQAFVNAEYPVSDNTTLYAFGGTSTKDTDAFAFDRSFDSERNVQSIYPNGFTPRITSIIEDRSISAGVRSTFKGWDVDFNNTYGINEFHYFIKGTLNASLGAASDTNFDAGGHTLSQNTTGITFSKPFDVLEGLNIAFGAEYRKENFTIFAGEEGSYTQYDNDGLPVTLATDSSDIPIAPNGERRPGGSQGFPGYSPDNEVDETRTNVSLYVDAELDITESVLIGGALRYENYSDFGQTLTGKFSSRFKITDGLNFRFSTSSGFRAPSLVQLYYNLSFSDFEEDELIETLLSPNSSPVTQSFGIQDLKEEKSYSVGGGFGFKFGKFKASIDTYYVKVNDRIVLTGSFPITNPDLPVSAARFFVNGVDTESYGVDLVMNYDLALEEHKLGFSFAGNWSQLNIQEIHNDGFVGENKDIFFNKGEQAFLTNSNPEYKATIGVTYGYEKFGANVATTFFGEVGPFVSNGGPTLENIYSPTRSTDISVNYEFIKGLKLVVGANNFFNEYPDGQVPEGTESFGRYDAVQQGFGGAFYYSKLRYSF